jgi:hypothetical protein
LSRAALAAPAFSSSTYLASFVVPYIGQVNGNLLWRGGGIAPDLNDAARTIEPNDIERQKTPVHPMAMMAGLLIDKEHAAILRKRIPIHEASR